MRDSDVPDQLVRQKEPLNTEPSSKRLAETYITPTELVFNRNHDSIIQAAPSKETDSSWQLSLSVEAGIPLSEVKAQSWTIAALRRDFALTEVVATLECAGNRRAALSPDTEGLPWGDAVIANVVWGGAALRQVLLSAGVPDPYSHHSDLSVLKPSEKDVAKDAAHWCQGLHLHMLSVQESSDSDDPSRTEHFASSVSLATAMHPNQHCLVAYQHNGEALLQRHGAPLRAALPGHVGARWVKWLSGIRISTNENDSPPMRRDYKLLSPPARSAASSESNWRNRATNDDDFRQEQLDKKKPLQRLEASSSIALPGQHGTAVILQDSQLHVKGYAVGQDGSPPAHVYVAVVEDPGTETSSEDLLESMSEVDWKEAVLRGKDSTVNASSSIWSWAWSLWHVDINVPTTGQFALVAKCGTYTLHYFRSRLSLTRFETVTEAGVEQERISQWNLRGFCNRSWPVVRDLSVKTQ